MNCDFLFSRFTIFNLADIACQRKLEISLLRGILNGAAASETFSGMLIVEIPVGFAPCDCFLCRNHVMSNGGGEMLPGQNISIEIVWRILCCSTYSIGRAAFSEPSRSFF